MVLGTWSRKDTLYGGSGYSVTGNGDLAEQLDAAVERLPEHGPDAGPPPPGPSPPPAFIPPPPERHITEGSFFVARRPDHPPGRGRPGRARRSTAATLLKADGTP